jgi:hypothetical protein
MNAGAATNTNRFHRPLDIRPCQPAKFRSTNYEYPDHEAAVEGTDTPIETILQFPGLFHDHVVIILVAWIPRPVSQSTLAIAQCSCLNSVTRRRPATLWTTCAKCSSVAWFSAVRVSVLLLHRRYCYENHFPLGWPAGVRHRSPDIRDTIPPLSHCDACHRKGWRLIQSKQFKYRLLARELSIRLETECEVRR